MSDYTPSETAERIKREWLATHAGSGFEDLYEAEWDRMIAQVRAETLREFGKEIRAYEPPDTIAGNALNRAWMIEKEAGL